MALLQVAPGARNVKRGDFTLEDIEGYESGHAIGQTKSTAIDDGVRVYGKLQLGDPYLCCIEMDLGDVKLRWMDSVGSWLLGLDGINHEQSHGIMIDRIRFVE